MLRLVKGKVDLSKVDELDVECAMRTRPPVEPPRDRFAFPPLARADDENLQQHASGLPRAS